MKTRVVVSAVIERDVDLLMGRKPKDLPPYPNTWHLPGGGIEEGESLEEGLRREIREETGVEIGEVRAIHFDEDVTSNKRGEVTRYIFLQYLASYKSGAEVPGSDFQSLDWIAKAELQSLADSGELAMPSVRLFRDLEWLR